MEHYETHNKKNKRNICGEETSSSEIKETLEPLDKYQNENSNCSIVSIERHKFGLERQRVTADVSGFQHIHESNVCVTDKTPGNHSRSSNDVQQPIEGFIASRGSGQESQ